MRLHTITLAVALLFGRILLVTCIRDLTAQNTAYKRADTRAVAEEGVYSRAVYMASTRIGPPHDAVDITYEPGLHDHEVLVPAASLPAAGALVVAAVFLIYWPKGPRVAALVLLYCAALCSMKLTVKWVYVTHSFPYPKLICTLHFLAAALVTGLLLWKRGKDAPKPSSQEFWKSILPIALSTGLSVVASNVALLFVSVGFTEIIGSLNSLITIPLVIILGLPFNRWLILPATVVALGCVIGTVGEANFSLLGTLLCIAAAIFRSVKVILQQLLMTGGTRVKFDPVALLFWTSLPCTVLMLVGSLATEGMAPYHGIAGRPSAALLGLVVAIVVSCINATILNMAQLFVTKDLGAVGVQLAAQAKMVVTVLGGMVLFGESITMLELAGFGLALVGVYGYSHMEQSTKDPSSV